MDSTNNNPKDKWPLVLNQVENWVDSKQKGSLTVYFDGSGRIPRFTITTEGH